MSRPALGPTQSPIKVEPKALSQGVNRSWREALHSPPSSDEAKNAWACPDPYFHYTMCLLKIDTSHSIILPATALI